MEEAHTAAVQVGEFELEQLVGAGGQGEVWRGRSRLSGAPVAVKVLRAVARDAFWREAAALASLDHRHIVRVFDVTRVDDEAARASTGRLPTGAPCVITEWLDAPSADRAGLWPLERLWPAALALLDALASAHARRLLHLDIKPSNVLVDGQGQPVLIDFGLAHRGDDRQGRRAHGTPGFMAPEVFRDDCGPVGPWSDLFGLGATLFVMSTGRLPFGGHDPSSRLLATLEAPAPSCPPPAAFAAWLGRMIERDPQHRFRHAAEAAEALLAVRDELSGSDLDTLDTALDPMTLPALSSLCVDTPSDRGAWDVALQPPPTASGPVAAGSAMPGWRRANDRGRTALPAGVGSGLLALRVLPFVGREAERDHLWAALAEVRDGGDARWLAVTGTRGVGKSRLLGWLVERVEELGLATTLPVTSPAGAAPLTGVIEAIRAHHLRSTLDAEALRDQLAALGLDDFQTMVMAELLEGTVDVAESDHGLVAALVERWLEGQATRRPVVVTVDDAEHAPATVELLARLGGRDALAVLVVFAGAGPLAVEVPPAARLALSALSDAEATFALEAGFGLAPSLSSELLTAAGNHLGDALMLLRAWLDAGQIERTVDGLQLRGVGRGVGADLVGARLGGLELELDAVEIAAALGLASSLTVARWRTIAARLDDGVAEETIARALDALRRREALLEGASGIHWRDRQLLEAIVERCRGRSRWCAIHTVGVELATPRSASQVVHLIEAGRPMQAWQVLSGMLDMRGADVMPLQIFERQRLVRLAATALDHADVPDDDVRRGELMLYESYALSTRWLASALERAEALLEAVDRHDWSSLRARALDRHGHALYPLGHIEEARASLEQAMALAGDDVALHRQAALHLAYANMLAGRLDAAIELFEAVIEGARRDGHARHLDRARALLSGVLAEQTGRTREALAISLEVIEQTTSLHTRNLAHTVAGSLQRWFGDYAASDAHFEQWRELLHREGSSSEMVTLHLAINRLLTGDIERARAMCTPELERLERGRRGHILATAHLVLAACAAHDRHRERTGHHLDRFEAEIGAVRAYDLKLVLDRMLEPAAAEGWEALAARLEHLATHHCTVELDAGAQPTHRPA